MLSTCRKLHETLATLEVSTLAEQRHAPLRSPRDRHRQKEAAEMKCGGIKDVSLPRLLPHPQTR